jgi:hypothetical protein
MPVLAEPPVVRVTLLWDNEQLAPVRGARARVTVPLKPYSEVIVTFIDAFTPGPTFTDPGVETIEMIG